MPTRGPFERTLAEPESIFLLTSEIESLHLNSAYQGTMESQLWPTALCFPPSISDEVGQEAHWTGRPLGSTQVQGRPA